MKAHQLGQNLQDLMILINRKSPLKALLWWFKPAGSETAQSQALTPPWGRELGKEI